MWKCFTISKALSKGQWLWVCVYNKIVQIKMQLLNKPIKMQWFMEGICITVLRNKGYIKQNPLSRVSPYILGHKNWGGNKKLKQNPYFKKGWGHGWMSPVAKSVASLCWETGLEAFAWVEQEKWWTSNNGQKLGNKQGLLENISQTRAPHSPASFQSWSHFLSSFLRTIFSFPLNGNLHFPHYL